MDNLEVDDPDRMAYLTQTTLSVDETDRIIRRLRERFPNITGPKSDDICYATTNRQMAVRQMARECDLVLVIGSRNSSNSNRLVEVARDHGADAQLVDNELQVLRSGSRASAWSASSSGASAPEELVQRLVEFFRARGTKHVSEFEVVQEDVRSCCRARSGRRWRHGRTARRAAARRATPPSGPEGLVEAGLQLGS